MVVPWFGWRMVDEYLARRKTVSIVTRYFVRRFVDEFERRWFGTTLESAP